MKTSLMVLSAIAALGIAGQALADGISYSYVEGDYLSSRLKGYGESIDGDGFKFEGSMAMGMNWLGFVDVGRTSYSESGESLKFTPTAIGVGFHTALGESFDFVAKASYDRVKVGFTGIGSSTESGWGLSAGLRGMIGEKVELSTGLRYRDVGDLESIVGFSVGGRYYITPAFAVGLDLSSDKYDKDVLGVREQIAAVTLRYNFGG
jgi:hypothetical protein